MNLVQFAKDILNKYPKLTTFLSFIYCVFYGRNIKKIKGISNVISIKGAFLRKCKITIIGDSNEIILGEKCKLLNCKIYIRGNNNKVILSTMVSAVDTEFYIEDSNNKIIIGSKTIFSGRTSMACIEGTTIDVGDDCLFSSEVGFRTGDSHSIMDNTGKRINYSQDIKIENHVWSGNKTIFTKGCYVSANSIIATGAIVTRKFKKSNVIIGGIPANIIKYDVNWDSRRI